MFRKGIHVRASSKKSERGVLAIRKLAGECNELVVDFELTAEFFVAAEDSGSGLDLSGKLGGSWRSARRTRGDFRWGAA